MRDVSIFSLFNSNIGVEVRIMEIKSIGLKRAIDFMEAKFKRIIHYTYDYKTPNVPITSQSERSSLNVRSNFLKLLSKF